MFSLGPPVAKLSRRSKVGRDDYRPEKVEFNLRTGIWTRAPQIKRYGFVEILERGQKIGLVQCAYCPVTCSKNSFKKIKTHYFREHNPDGQTEDLEDETEEGDSREMERLSIESILSRLTAALPPVDAPEVTNYEEEEEEEESKEVAPSPVIVLKDSPPSSRPLTPPASLPLPSSSAPTAPAEEDSLGTMVNSTFRTISSQNRRLAIEFKCALMKIMSEFEMRMLDGSGERK